VIPSAGTSLSANDSVIDWTAGTAFGSIDQVNAAGSPGREIRPSLVTDCQPQSA